jgi:N-methylhydantoinase B
VVDLIHGALASVCPDRVTAASNGACSSVQFVGRGGDGALWGYVESIGGGSGARRTKDGLDGVHVHMTNTSNLPVEALEIEYPLTLMRYELVNGSGGAGRQRGGMGIRRVYRADAECRFRYDLTRMRSQPWGLDGGLPGGGSAISFTDATVERENATLHPGCVVAVVTGGSGGHGPPRERDPALARADFDDDCIDAATLRATFGIAE